MFPITTSHAFLYRVSIAILRMPLSLDYSHVIPQVNGATNLAYEHSSTDNLRVTSSKFMHIDSNLNIRGLAMDASPINGTPPGEMNMLKSLNIFKHLLCHQLRYQERTHKRRITLCRENCRRKWSTQ